MNKGCSDIIESLGVKYPIKLSKNIFSFDGEDIYLPTDGLIPQLKDCMEVVMCDILKVSRYDLLQDITTKSSPHIDIQPSPYLPLITLSMKNPQKKLPPTFYDLLATEYIKHNEFYDEYIPDSIGFDKNGDVITDKQEIITCNNKRCDMCWECLGGKGEGWKQFPIYLCYIQLMKYIQNGKYKKDLLTKAVDVKTITTKSNSINVKTGGLEFSLFEESYKLFRCIKINEFNLVLYRKNMITIPHPIFVSIIYNDNISYNQKGIFFSKYFTEGIYIDNYNLNKFYLWYLKMFHKPDYDISINLLTKFMDNINLNQLKDTPTQKFNSIYKQLCRLGEIDPDAFDDDDIELIKTKSSDILELYWYDILYTGGKLGKKFPLPLDGQIYLTVLKHITDFNTKNEEICKIATKYVVDGVYPSLSVLLNPSLLYEMCQNGKCNGDSVGERMWNEFITGITKERFYEDLSVFAPVTEVVVVKIIGINYYIYEHVNDVAKAFYITNDGEIRQIRIPREYVRDYFHKRQKYKSSVISVLKYLFSNEKEFNSPKFKEDVYHKLKNQILDSETSELIRKYLTVVLEHTTIVELPQLTKSQIEGASSGMWDNFVGGVKNLFSDKRDQEAVKTLYANVRGNVSLETLAKIPEPVKFAIDTHTGIPGITNMIVALLCSARLTAYRGMQEFKRLDWKFKALYAFMTVSTLAIIAFGFFTNWTMKFPQPVTQIELQQPTTPTTAQPTTPTQPQPTTPTTAQPTTPTTAQPTTSTQPEQEFIPYPTPPQQPEQQFIPHPTPTEPPQQPKNVVVVELLHEEYPGSTISAQTNNLENTLQEYFGEIDYKVVSITSPDQISPNSIVLDARNTGESLQTKYDKIAGDLAASGARYIPLQLVQGGGGGGETVIMHDVCNPQRIVRVDVPTFDMSNGNIKGVDIIDRTAESLTTGKCKYSFGDEILGAVEINQLDQLIMLH